MVRLHVAIVERRVNLATALDQIQRSHRGVGKALYMAVSDRRLGSGYSITNTGQHSTECTCCIVLGSPGLDLARLFLGLLASNVVFPGCFLGEGVGLLFGSIDCTPGRERLAPLEGRLDGLLPVRLLLHP